MPLDPRKCEHVNCVNGPDGGRGTIPTGDGKRGRRRKYCSHECGQLQNRIESKERLREKRMSSHPHKAVRKCLY